MNVLETKNLSKTYGENDNTVEALKGINIKVENGEFIAVVGTSGSGKSTLLNLIGGLDRPTNGTVLIEGKNIFELEDDEITILRRRKIGFVFQSYNLIPILNVRENIVLPVELDGETIDEEYLNVIIDSLGLQDKLDKLPNELSGGQQQRVAIARSLIAKPTFILADEPTGNLDSKTSLDVIGLLKISSERLKQTIIMITHNESLSQMADRVIRIEDGLIVRGGQYEYSL